MAFNLNKLVQPECGGSNPLVSAAHQIARIPSGNLSMIRPQRPISQINFSNEFMKQNAAAQLSATSQPSPTNQLPVNRPGTDNSSNLLYSNVQLRPVNLSMSGGRLATDFLTDHEISQGVERVHINTDHAIAGPSSMAGPFAQPSMLNHQSAMRMGMNNMMPETTMLNASTAGEQLEIKYRNDMISRGSSYKQDSAKVDDVAFWQSISQKYIGPTTYDNIAKMKGKTATMSAKSEEKSAEEESQDMVSESDWYPDERTEQSELEYIFDERNPLKDQFDDPFAEGLKKLEQGDIPSAALLFEAAVQKDPNNAAAWRYLGTTQALNEKDNSAIRALKNCLKLDQKDQQARLALSVSLANETQQSEACKYLLEWLVNNDRYNSVGASLQEYHQLDAELTDTPLNYNWVDEKHYKYVRDKFVEAARMSPNNPDPEIQSALGVLFNIYGEYDKAVDCFKAALSVKADDSLLWNRLGATLANGNKSDEAVVAYRVALNLSPGSLRSRYNLAISLVHLNTYDEAARQLIQILNMQAAGKGSKNELIRTRSITSAGIWNTLRTVATLMNRPDLYPIIDGRDLARCNEEIFKVAASSPTD